MPQQRTPKIDAMAGQHPELKVRPISSREDLEQSFRLVYRSYLLRGYVLPDETEIRFSIFNFLPGAVTFVGLRGDEVVATVSVIPDTPMGLPMDAVFRDELQPLRDAGRRLAEVTMLADRRTELRRTLPMLLDMMKLLFDYSTLVLKANELCITINPRHELFYKRYLLFQPVGEVKQYASVCNNPALAERLDLDNVRAACNGNRKLLAQFFESRTPMEVLEDRYTATPEDVHYFCVELCPLLAEASPEALEQLKVLRPDCPWDAWRAECL